MVHTGTAAVRMHTVVRTQCKRHFHVSNVRNPSPTNVSNACCCSCCSYLRPSSGLSQNTSVSPDKVSRELCHETQFAWACATLQPVRDSAGEKGRRYEATITRPMARDDVSSPPQIQHEPARPNSRCRPPHGTPVLRRDVSVLRQF